MVSQWVEALLEVLQLTARAPPPPGFPVCM